MSLDTLNLKNTVLTVDGGVGVLRLNRASKRNALDAATIEELVSVFDAVGQSEVRVVVLCADGDHFSAGLDLVEHYEQGRTAVDFMRVCHRWHEAFNKMEYSGVPIIAALKGAVVGGGLELASSAHIRVADQTAYFALPEGMRGLFTGGGATIRVADLVGKSRMIDMMLTGRIYRQQEAMDVGLCQYLVDGDSEAKAMELARRVAENPPLSNYAICSTISHVQNMSALDASYFEAVMAGLVNTQPEANKRLAEFAAKKAELVKPKD